MALSGLRLSAPRVLSGTGWSLPDGFRAFGPGSYIVPLRQRGTAPYGAIIYRLTAEELPRSGLQNGARRAPTSLAERYYITPEGASPQPACKAKPITGRTLPAQGVSPAAGSTLAPQARQPSGIQLSAAIVALQHYLLSIPPFPPFPEPRRQPSGNLPHWDAFPLPPDASVFPASWDGPSGHVHSSFRCGRSEPVPGR